MSAVATSPQTPQAPASSLAAVPRAVWIALGAFALATAGMAGALVMNAIGDKEPVTAQTSMQAAPTQVAGFEQQQPQPAAVQPSNLQVAPQQTAQPVAQAAPAPVAKPKPAVVQKPAPVRQASGSSGQPAPQVVSQAPAQPAYTPVQQRAVCGYCGTVEHVTEIKEKGEGSGLGAVGGAVVGGLLGNQVGGGNGKKVMTVVGAAGGALAGHQIEKHVRGTTVYNVQVRMEDGSVRTVRHTQPVSVGARVTVEGGTLRVGGQSGGAVPATVAPRTLHTSAPAMYGN